MTPVERLKFFWVDPRAWPDRTPTEAERKRLQQQRYARCQSFFPRLPCGKPLAVPPEARARPLRDLFGGIKQSLGGKQLLIVPSASLMQLQFSALVTEMPNADVPHEMEGYRGVKWLGTQRALTILPSIGSLAALRRNARASNASKAWVGFGNPVALTTQAFAEARKDPGIGRAEALRRSMLALSTDRSNPRGSHPSVWAPFVLVGEAAR